jgi:hypothetical protein
VILTLHGEERWLNVADATGFGAPVRVSFFLPFTDGDAVLMGPALSLGMVVGWEVTGRRLETEVVYHVRLDGTCAGEEVEVDVRDPQPRPPI